MNKRTVIFSMLVGLLVGVAAFLSVQSRPAHAGTVGVALEAARLAPEMITGPIRNGTTFSVTCSTTAAGVAIKDTAGGVEWSALYCENNSTTTIFYGWAVAGTLSTSDAPCVSTTSANCLKSSISIDARRNSGLACKTSAGTATLKCIAGGN